MNPRSCPGIAIPHAHTLGAAHFLRILWARTAITVPHNGQVAASDVVVGVVCAGARLPRPGDVRRFGHVVVGVLTRSLAGARVRERAGESHRGAVSAQG